MTRIVIGLGSCGIAAGGRRVQDAVQQYLRASGLVAQVGITGCLGLCYREVLVEVEGGALGRCLYGDVTPELLPALLDGHLRAGVPLAGHLISRGETYVAERDFFAHQERLVLGRCGRIDPESLEDYVAHGGYQALARALATSSPAAVLGEIETSGLRGRGGAGFPTARKWRLARDTPASLRYVVCNADEGDPGAFMDRNLLEGDPHSVLEGMILAAWAIGAAHGIVYVREEYPLAVERLDRAVAQARAAGWLGDAVGGSGFAFDVSIHRGAGAFVCGEETALIAALEGERGIPRRRPPFPAERGLWQQPTSINNVETYANVTWILGHGAAAFARHGSCDSSGTKVFSLAGDVRRGGMVEVPLGATLRTVIETIGGGSRSGRPIKAVQIGGPSGGCVPAELFDTRIDYEALRATGAIMGSGGLVVMDDTACMVDVARYFVAFTQDESCGRCSACRVGTRRMLEILERICAGHGRRGDLEQLESLATLVGASSACGLGRAAPNPVLTTLRWFRAEFEAHIAEQRCPAGRCRDLVRYEIEPYVCDGCTRCAEQCASMAINLLGDGIPMAIDAAACIRCGGCREVCEFGAVMLN